MFLKADVSSLWVFPVPIEGMTLASLDTLGHLCSGRECRISLRYANHFWHKNDLPKKLETDDGFVVTLLRVTRCCLVH